LLGGVGWKKEVLIEFQIRVSEGELGRKGGTWGRIGRESLVTRGERFEVGMQNQPLRAFIFDLIGLGDSSAGFGGDFDQRRGDFQ